MPSLESHFRAVTGLLQGRAGPDSLAALMRPGADIGPRALVYRNSSLLAASDALKSNYSATAKIMGDDFFGGMARAYIQANRATGRSLVGYGQTLPEFISAAESEHGMPWLADLARLDWAWLQSHIAADSDQVQAADFAALASDEAMLMEARFAFAPSVQQVDCDWQVYDLWANLQADNLPEQAVSIDPGCDHVLIWRVDWDVDFRRLPPAEAIFLDQIESGATLGSAAEAALLDTAGFDIGQALAIAIENGLFVSPLENEG